MFHPFIIYGILCDSCHKVFNDPGTTGFIPIVEPKLSDVLRDLLHEQGWRAVGNVALCPDHIDDAPPIATSQSDKRLQEDNRRLRAENRRLWEQLAQQVDKEN
ncbi:hypothetical protein [Nocardiopsis lucentensis]|uniref:hypothetical protein n=1 Tax=Nocardiopsis lucentensis TaxID=53441 RepID=UPI00034D9190|nr:hypothetical protein [Nocardiopsis lucentensis]